MADTIIAPVARDNGESAVGWAIAVLLLLGVVLFGVFIWPGLPSRVAPSTPTDTRPNIDLNVTVPEAMTPGTNQQGTQGGTQNSGGGTPGTQTQ